jgi:hypothetical protein
MMRALGARRTMRKPLRPAELRAVVREWLNGQPSNYFGAPDYA